MQHEVEWEHIHKGKFGAYLFMTNLFEAVFYYPFWVLKTREQLVRTEKLSSLHILSEMKKNGQLRSLYRGFWSGTTLACPSYLLYFFTYHKMKHFLDSFEGGPLQSTPFIAGMTADVLSIGVYTPIDVVVQRLQAADSPYKNARHAFKSIVKNEGISGLFRGLKVSAVTYGIGSGVWWQTYEPIRICATPSDPTRLGELRGSVLGGFFAGITTVISTNPLDVVKTRIQVNQNEKPFFRSFIEVGRNEGIYGYFKGCWPRFVSRVPLSAMSAILYQELVLRYSKY